jgi:glycosyltransferase involved in cell wall biosynthesis
MTKGEVVIAVSETVREYILTNYPSCPPERIKLIYRGVDPEEFPYGYKPNELWLAQWQADFPQLKEKVILCLPGRITRLKGHEDFLHLIFKLHSLGEPVHGLIVGGVEEQKRTYFNEIEALVSELGLQNLITFTGFRRDMREIFSQCNLVLSLSTKPETFGRTVLEALSLGTPVVAWDQGGVSEVLMKIYPQGAVKTNDFCSLHKTTISIIRALPSPQQSPFSLTSMCNKTLATYNKILDLRP